MVVFTKESLDTYKPILVGNIPPLKFAGGTKNQGITGNTQRYWDPDISVAMVKAVVVLLE